MNKYDRILLISGGIGYTFTYPIFKDLVISVFEQRSNCRYIDFVWTIRTLGLCLRVMQRPIFSHFSLLKTQLKSSRKIYVALRTCFRDVSESSYITPVSPTMKRGVRSRKIWKRQDQASYLGAHTLQLTYLTAYGRPKVAALRLLVRRYFLHFLQYEN